MVLRQSCSWTPCSVTNIQKATVVGAKDTCVMSYILSPVFQRVCLLSDYSLLCNLAFTLVITTGMQRHNKHSLIIV